jgi:uncharacterized membrane protein
MENNNSKKGVKSNWLISNIWVVFIIVIVVILIGRIMNRPDRELTPEEKKGNESICRQYYGNTQEYQDCINGNYGRN